MIGFVQHFLIIIAVVLAIGTSQCGNCLNTKKGLNLPSFSKLLFGLFSSIIFLLKINIWRRWAEAILAVNEFYKKYYASYGVDPSKILVIPPKRILIPFQDGDNFVLQNIDSIKSVNVLYVGRLITKKA